jgi:hypothetical protein
VRVHIPSWKILARTGEFLRVTTFLSFPLCPKIKWFSTFRQSKKIAALKFSRDLEVASIFLQRGKIKVCRNVYYTTLT